uniref:Immunoglobulin V-set domain-containing protein n=1 Tax=Electrophorus electricus TaxID=8005 RepID=A0A4W4E1Y6_ELEEL
MANGFHHILTNLQLSLQFFTVSHDELRLIGTSVQMEVQDHESKLEDFIWNFSKTKNVIKYYNDNKKIKVNPSFEGRVEFNIETYSLTLMNLQKSDSGQYEAQTSDFKDKTVAMYNLSVLEPVETPVLTPVPHQQSKDPCNVTVFCRGHDLSVSFGCYNYTCEESKVRSHGDNTIELYFQDKSIICNHSNAVSWNESIIEMNELCSSEGTITLPLWLWPVIASVAATVILLLLVIGFFALCKWGKTGISSLFFPFTPIGHFGHQREPKSKPNASVSYCLLSR